MLFEDKKAFIDIYVNGMAWIVYVWTDQFLKHVVLFKDNQSAYKNKFNGLYTFEQLYYLYPLWIISSDHPSFVFASQRSHIQRVESHLTND